MRLYESVYLIGNGGSNAVASHICNDLVKAQGMRAYPLTDPAIMTCMANDYGYDYAMRETLGRWITDKDALICISSSGRSFNVCEAAEYALAAGAFVATFTGFAEDNPLRRIGAVNYWTPSDNYGVVEIAHLTILHSIANPG